MNETEEAIARVITAVRAWGEVAITALVDVRAAIETEDFDADEVIAMIDRAVAEMDRIRANP